VALQQKIQRGRIVLRPVHPVEDHALIGHRTLLRLRFGSLAAPPDTS
jgi:hypothetical protein